MHIAGPLRRSGRWWLVALGVAALCALPSVVATLPIRTGNPGAVADAAHPATREAAPAPRALLARILDGSRAPYEGLVEVRSSLGLPDLPQLEDATGLLRGRTRARVWWQDQQRWRVAVLRPAGERDTYGVGEATVAFDYERNESRTVLGDPPVRLPRADDLLPPQVAQRLLRGVGERDAVSRLPARRVAGRTALGVRVSPTEPDTTVGSLDVWADARSALPLRVELHATGRRNPSFVSELLAVTLERPTTDELRVRIPPDARTELTTQPDIVAALDRRARWVLPDQVGGLPRTPDMVRTRGTASYGTGFTRVLVLPLPPYRLADFLARADGSPGATTLHLPTGDAVLMGTPLLQAALVSARETGHGYLLAGTVRDDLLHAVIADLLTTPPVARW